MGVFRPEKKESWKIIALTTLAAMIFWFLNALNKTYTYRVDQPITFVYKPEGTILTKDLPTHITLEVTATGWKLMRRAVNFKIPQLKVTLERPIQTDYLISTVLRPIADQSIRDVEINYIIRDTLWLFIEEKVERRIPLYVDKSVIDTKEMYRVTSEVELEPDSVTLRGPKSFLEKIGDTLTLTIQDKRIDRDYDKNIDLTRTVHNLIIPEPTSVSVKFAVRKFTRKDWTATVTLKKVPKKKQISLADTAIHLSFIIQEDLYEQWKDSISFDVQANYADINKEDSTVRPTLVGYTPDFLSDVILDTVALRLQYGN